MGASNFYNKNASRIFACELEEEWSFNDLFENLRLTLEEEFRFTGFSEPENDGDRSYPMNYIADKRVIHEYKDFTIYVTIKAGIRSAYYEGCNLDWHLEYDWDYGFNEDMTPDFFQTSFLKEDLEHNLGYSEENASRYALWASKKLEQLGQGLIDELEAVYAKHCGIELKRVATFSNGESIYEEVS